MHPVKGSYRAYVKQGGQNATHAMRLSMNVYLSITVTLDAMLRPHEYADLLDDEVWSWDPDTRTKAQGLYSALLSFEFVMSFLSQRVALNRYVQ